MVRVPFRRLECPLLLGFSVESGGKHTQIRTITGKLIYTLPASPSDHRALKNAVGDLRNMGVLPPANKARLRAVA